jgi:hypothetical protein
MNPEIANSISALIRFTNLEQSELLAGSDYELGRLNWEKIDKAQFTTQREFILIEILRFLSGRDTVIPLSALKQLPKDDLGAVVMALQTYLGFNKMAITFN